MIRKSARAFELAMAFWIGIGLMSIINVWKIISSANAVQYSWIMFGFSVFFIIIAAILYFFRKR